MEQKNGCVWFWAKCSKTARKLRKSVILRNILQREYYQPETIYFVQIIDNREIWIKKKGEFGFWIRVRKLPENSGKVLFYET